MGSACTVHPCHVENLDLPPFFRGIFCLCSLYHVPRARLTASLQNLSRHLVNGGVILFTIPSGPPYLDRENEHGQWNNYMGASILVKHVNAIGGLKLLHIDESFQIYTGLWNLIIAQKM